MSGCFWSEDDIARLARTAGVEWLTAEHQKRLTDRANDAATTARAMRRVASKFDEPAHVFKPPPSA